MAGGNPLDDWIAELCRALEVDPSLVDRNAVLDLARDAAHGVARPAAPVTTYVAGIAVGLRAAAGDSAAVDAVTAALTSLLSTRGNDQVS
jgi:hypothetical protein